MDTSNPPGPADSRAVPPPLPTFANEPTIELSAADLEPSERPPTSLAGRVATAESKPQKVPSSASERAEPAAKQPSSSPQSFWTTGRVLLLAAAASVVSGALVYLVSV